MTSQVQIILASASPRRRELLQQIGISVVVQAVDIDETQRQDEQAADYVQRLAMEKASQGYKVIENPHGLPVLGSDTIVELNGEILGKPENRQRAKLMLQRLSGKKHTVHTAVAIVTSKLSVIDINSSEVWFKQLAESEIDRYLMTGEADDKAGSYAIQGVSAQFITNINGSFSAVMGLPLFETAQLLKQCGIQLLR